MKKNHSLVYARNIRILTCCYVCVCVCVCVCVYVCIYIYVHFAVKSSYMKYPSPFETLKNGQVPFLGITNNIIMKF